MSHASNYQSTDIKPPSHSPTGFASLLILAAVAMAVLSGVGCVGRTALSSHQHLTVPVSFTESTRIAQPALCDSVADSCSSVVSTTAPRTLSDGDTPELRDISLQEAVQSALMHSQVFRELGGAVLRSPDSIGSIHTPAMAELDPRFGVEGALSAFDALWTTRMAFENNDRALNNQFFGGGTRLLQQDYGVLNNALTKRTAFGTQLTGRHLIEYDFNNAPGNNVPNLPWHTNLELEVRQPLLNGAGTEINRIAGPGNIPGFYNGVLIARVKTDISLADFESSVASMLNNVETAYWEVYFAYRNLDAQRDARDRALETWRRIKSLADTGRRGGDPAAEARAREQYYRLEADVQNALAGRDAENNPSARFRGEGGIYAKERQLRLLMGLPINDGVVLNPVTKPVLAEIRFDWSSILYESVQRRPELRRQKWKIRQRELELTAAQHRLKPQLDAFGRYRWRGLGQDLISQSGNSEFDNAFQNLTSGNYQEWQVGVEYTIPVGMRQAHTAVSHAMMNLRRDKSVLEEQHREVALELSNAVAETDRAYHLLQINLNRRLAAADHVKASDAVFEGADESQKPRLLDVLLDAQRRLSEAETTFQATCIEYVMAVRQVHAAKGSLLDYNEVQLSEGQWPDQARQDAADRNDRREFEQSPRDPGFHDPVIALPPTASVP